MDGLQLNIDGLGDLASRIANKVVDLLLDNPRIKRLLNDRPSQSSNEIYGVDPYELYTTAEVAERFHMSKSGVRNLPREDLPRAPWRGFENRYRGIDILRFEGVPVDDYLPLDEYLGDIDGEYPERVRKQKEAPKHYTKRESSSRTDDRLPRRGTSDEHTSESSSSGEKTPMPGESASEEKEQQRETAANHPNLPEL